MTWRTQCGALIYSSGLYVFGNGSGASDFYNPPRPRISFRLFLLVSFAASSYVDIKRTLASLGEGCQVARGTALAKIMTLFAKRLHINHFGNLLLQSIALPPFSFLFLFPNVHSRFVIYRRATVFDRGYRPEKNTRAHFRITLAFQISLCIGSLRISNPVIALSCLTVTRLSPKPNPRTENLSLQCASVESMLTGCGRSRHEAPCSRITKLCLRSVAPLRSYVSICHRPLM